MGSKEKVFFFKFVLFEAISWSVSGVLFDPTNYYRGNTGNIIDR